MTNTPATRRAAAALFAVVALVPTGCGPSVGAVSGHVTMSGSPVGGVVVSFVAEDGTIKSGDAGPDGFYTVNDVPAGPVKITVQAASEMDEAAQQALKKSGKAAPKKAKTPIPDRYLDSTTSGLSTTVKSGPNTYDIVLTP